MELLLCAGLTYKYVKILKFVISLGIGIIHGLYGPVVPLQVLNSKGIKPEMCSAAEFLQKPQLNETAQSAAERGAHYHTI